VAATPDRVERSNGHVYCWHQLGDRTSKTQEVKVIELDLEDFDILHKLDQISFACMCLKGLTFKTVFH